MSDEAENNVARKIDVETTPSLLLRIRDHTDTNAWDTFAEVYRPLIFNFSRFQGLQSEDAADVAQEVLVRVARAIREFEYEPRTGLFRDWIARIVQNEISRHRSKTARKQVIQNVSLDEPESTTSQAWNEQFQQHIFKCALERSRGSFTEETWQLFQQSWLEKRSAQEVADEKGIGVEKVYVARSRVLKRLRQEVAHLAEDYL